MNLKQKRIWDNIKTTPHKWHLSPWGDLGNGFWVVGIIGSLVIWYNDIEDGFNLSKYTEYGVIERYYCNQDKLEWTIQLLDELINGPHEGKDINY